MTVFSVRLVLLDKGANVAKRLAQLNLHTDIGRCVGDADAELEPAARNLMQIGSVLRELVDRLRIDRRYGGGKWNALGRQCEADALRHIAERTRHRDPAKPRRSISRAVSSVARRRPGSAIRLRAGLIIARYLRRDRYLKHHPPVTSDTAPPRQDSARR